jgi:succinate dehydrogenase / fumarate reductase cytochrome b subunit
VITLRLIPGLNGQSASFALMQSQLHQAWILVLYLIGVLGTIYHFSNGLWSFSVHWGITVGPRAQRAMGYVSAGVFVVLAAMALRAILVFA